MPGILAWHRGRSVLILALHGSILPGDWLTNFDCRKTENDRPGLDIRGKLHRGFATKVSQYQSLLKERLGELVQSMSETERQNLIIFLTGHSHGAALAQLTAPLVIKFLRDEWQSSFDNSKANKVQVYRLAAPRCIGDNEAYDDIQSAIGECNNIRQNMSWDLIPNVMPGEKITAALARFSFGFSNSILGHRSGGKLALQHSWPMIRRSILTYIYYMRLRSIKAWITVLINFMLNPHFVSAAHPRCVFGFDPALVERDIRRLLANGYAHVQKKQEAAAGRL